MKKIPLLLLTLCFLILCGCAPASADAAAPDAGDTQTGEPVTDDPADTGDPVPVTPDGGDDDGADAAADPDDAPAPDADAAPALPEYDFSAPAPETDMVDDDYFADAAFLGDSRTEGMMLYGNIDADFFCGMGATVENVFTKENVTVDGQTMTIMDALARKQYGKIYLSFGLNELGWAFPYLYEDAYKTLIDAIRALQPDAVIYVEDLMPVNPALCVARNQFSYINNDNITIFNDMIYDLAKEKQIVLLKVSEIFTDENGELPSDFTTDGVHLTLSGCEDWCDYLRAHTVDFSQYAPVVLTGGETTEDGQ